MLSALDRLLCFLLPVIIHSSFLYKMSFEWDTDGLLKLKELMPGGTVLQTGLTFLFLPVFYAFFCPRFCTLSMPHSTKYFLSLLKDPA